MRMPPRIKYSKENVIEAAFEIAREQGFSEITARSVAKRLGSSVAPIYANFETIDHLVKAVVQRVFAVADNLLKEQEGSNVFANIGRASLAFARDYPILFRELMLIPNEHMVQYEAMEAALLDIMSRDERLRNWTTDERRMLLFEMRTFQTGLSVMTANGHLPVWFCEKDIEAFLSETGDKLIYLHEISRKGNSK
jgi:AcrR family transcriptional regulator